MQLPEMQLLQECAKLPQTNGINAIAQGMMVFS
jgi:hypothetical protein